MSNSSALGNQLMELKNSVKSKDDRFWFNWFESQFRKFKRNKIGTRQFYDRSLSFAHYIRKRGISNSTVEKLIAYQICPNCLGDLNTQSFERGICPNCNVRLASTNYDKEIFPNSTSILTRFNLFWKIFVNPKRAFSEMKYGMTSLIHPISILLVSVIFLGLYVSTIVPRIIILDDRTRDIWIATQDTIISNTITNFLIYSVIMLFAYSLVVYLMTLKAPYYNSYFDTLKITSFLLLPKMIFVPVYTYLNLLSNEGTILFPLSTSISEGQFRLLYIFDYAGVWGFALKILVNVLFCVFLFYALNHTWKYEPDTSMWRAILTGWIILIISFGIPIFI